MIKKIIALTESGGLHSNKKKYQKMWALFDTDPADLLKMTDLHGKDVDYFKATLARIGDLGERVRFIRQFWSDIGEVLIKKVLGCDDAHLKKIKAVLKRFYIGGMSFGSTSEETAKCNAMASNLLGLGGSNTGEGGALPQVTAALIVISTPSKFRPKELDAAIATLAFMHSSVQIASGRFGVTLLYLATAGEIQIKFAQGAKPGEGGQLPGHKVVEIIAKSRLAPEGKPLISPATNHDVYSIEDLLNLISRIRAVNKTARISIKLASGNNIGSIATGAILALKRAIEERSKDDKDKIWGNINIAGREGGTGAGKDSARFNTGGIQLLGLSEVHQATTSQGLRKNVSLRVSGAIHTPEDIIKMACLGAGEYEMGTAVLNNLGCIYVKECHTGNCPVGIAMAKGGELFKGRVSDSAFAFLSLAEEVVKWMADRGIKDLSEIVGHSEWLEYLPKKGSLLSGVKPVIAPFAGEPDPDESDSDSDDEFSDIDEVPVPDKVVQKAKETIAKFSQKTNRFKIDNRIIEIIKAKRNLDKNVTNEELEKAIHSDSEIAKDGWIRVDYRFQCVVSRLSSYLLTAPTAKPLNLRFRGTAGQSLGAYAHNVNLYVDGPINDHGGNGQGHADIFINGPAGMSLGYGATDGFMAIFGKVGARFNVRSTNKKRETYVKDGDDFAYEYVTGGFHFYGGRFRKSPFSGMTDGKVVFFNRKNRKTPGRELTEKEKDRLINLWTKTATGYEQFKSEKPCLAKELLRKMRKEKRHKRKLLRKLFRRTHKNKFWKQFSIYTPELSKQKEKVTHQ